MTFNIHKDQQTKNKQDRIHATIKAKNAYLAVNPLGNTVITRESGPLKWKADEIKVLLKSLKTKQDGAMPKTKDKILTAYLV